MIKITGRKKCFKCGKEDHPVSHFPEVNKKYDKKKEHIRRNYEKSRASQSIKSSKSDISELKIQMKNKFTTTEANIDELGDEDSDIISFDSEDSSGNSHFQFHNNPTSFTEPKKFRKYRENYYMIPGVTNPTGVMLQQAFE